METRGYYEALALLQSVTDGGHGLLRAALRERLDRDLEVIFRLLGLQYPQKDIFFAYSALRSTQADRRASAVEFLDNVLSKNLKSLIVPLLEESSPARLIEHASRQFGIRTPGRETALRSIMEQPDSWLRACAAHEIGRAGLSSLAHMCRKAAGDGDPVVRESAEWALRRIT